MLIALEGVDGSGKTSVVEKLKENGLIWDVLHSGPTKPDTDVLDEYVSRLMFYRPGHGLAVVLDRWHIGELIYGPLYRGESLLDQPQTHYIDMVLAKLGAAKFVLSPSDETVRHRLGQRGEELLRVEHVERVNREYRRLGMNLGWTTVRNDHLSVEDLARHAVDTASRNGIYAERLNPFPNYVGTPHPHLLLVGDERNPSRRDELPHQLAFPPYRGSSGHFLLSALVDAKLDPNYVGITNANDQDDVLQLWKTLGMPRATVALGVNATKTLGKLNIPHFAVEHPQYVRRFRTKQRKAYGQLIKSCYHTPRPTLDPEMMKV